jgi:ferrous iron transport protein B
MFFVGINSGLSSLFLSTGILLLIVLFCILMTFFVSRILSMTILSGCSSSFILELTPYRRPRIMKTIVTSVFDRTLFVLGRAIMVAIPSGFFIWCLANINISGISILNHLISFFDPFGSLFGLDGVIVVAFILGFPANEIIMPIMLMCYLNTGSLVEYSSLLELRALLINNGWTLATAISVIILFVLHYPCSTACLTIKKETDSWYYTFLSMIIPTFLGLFSCLIINLLFG